MEGCRDRQHQRALGALVLQRGGGGFDGALVAGNDELPAAIVIGDLAAFAAVIRRVGASLGHIHRFQPDDGRHGAAPGGHRRLHGIAANAQKPRGVRQRKRADRRMRRIFTQRMARRVSARLGEIDALGFQHPHHGHGHRHQRRLGIGRQRQGLFRPVPDDGGQLFAQRLVNFLEDRPRLGIGVRQGLAHADALRALPRKCECCGHGKPRSSRNSRDRWKIWVWESRVGDIAKIQR